MASTSTSNPIADSATITSNYFDIFINHRGPGVKETLATHLYKRFNFYGLTAFLDKDEMDLGDNIPSFIKAAIRCAGVHIAIFSTRYAESSWCLNELLLMLESGKTIIPIFYGVKPSTLRRAVDGNGTYDASLRTLEGETITDCHTRLQKPRYDTETVEKWREALSQAANLEGLTIEYVAPEAYNSDDNQHVDRVVERVLKDLERTTLNVSKYIPSGLDDKLKDFRLLLSKHTGERSRVVGIVGLGGVGKTTLAKDFFNREESKYDRSCFLLDVRETEARSSLRSLQSTLVQELTKSPVEIDKTAKGIELLRKRVSSCNAHALVILDDVDHRRQLDALVYPIQNGLRSGSLILVTSRNMELLTNFGIDPNSIYKLEGLGPEHSQELFCRHAFAQPDPRQGFETMVANYLDACQGLPLSLEVIGASLYGNHDLKDWKEQLDKISIIIPEDIQSVLKISYDGLDEELKKMFLDIACFFQGGELVSSYIGKDGESKSATEVFEDTDTIRRIWDGSGWGGSLGLRKLQNRCLVDVKGKHLRMHDHLRDMGRDLAQKELLGGHRLWQPTENLDSDLPDQSAFQRTISVRGIKCIQPFKTPEDLSKRSRPDKRKRRRSSVQIPAGLGNRSKSITELELLRTEGDCLTDILERVQKPDSLIWLSCYSFPYASLPCWVPKKKLTVLQLQGHKLRSLWKESEAPPVMLRELSICAPLSKFPVSIGFLEDLEKIVVWYGCEEESMNVPLETLPDEFCHLRCLKYLELKSCSKLQSLPELFGKLRSLQHLSLDGCSKLRTLPDSFGNLINLEYLNLEWCTELRTLPDSFGNLINLKYLNLEWCTGLRTLPDSFGNLINLEYLNLDWCGELRTLPDSFGKLINLKHLTLRMCSSLTMSNYTFGNIERLEYLCMTGCEILEVLPPQVIHQRHLKKLSVANTKLKQLPSEVGDLINLEHLEFGGRVLATLPTWLGSLRSLKRLEFHSFGQSKNLPDSIREWTQLKWFDIFGSGEEFLPPCILELNNLERLTLRLGTFRELPFKKLGGERETATNSTKDASIGCMRGLETLYLDRTQTSEVAFCEGVCPNLSSLSIDLCPSLVQVGTLPYSLRRLGLTSCENLEKIEGLAGLEQLQTLKIGWCKVVELSGLGTLNSLETLEIEKCGELTSILELQQLRKLRELKVSYCAALQTLQGIQSLMSLGTLYVESCPSLQWGEGVLECLRLREDLSLQLDDHESSDEDYEDYESSDEDYESSDEDYDNFYVIFIKNLLMMGWVLDIFSLLWCVVEKCLLNLSLQMDDGDDEDYYGSSDEDYESSHEDYDVSYESSD